MTYNGEERRKFVRADFNCKAVLQHKGEIFITHTENISGGGMNVFLDSKFPAGSQFDARLYFRPEKPIRCQARAVWSISKMNPLENIPVLYAVGMQFRDLSEEDQDYIRRLVGVLAVKETN